MIRSAGDTGQLYGSVSARDIADAVTEAGFTLVRSQIVLDKAIKVLGLHPIRVRLHPEVAIEIQVNVARSAAEAETQATTASTLMSIPHPPLIMSSGLTSLKVQYLSSGNVQ